MGEGLFIHLPHIDFYTGEVGGGHIRYRYISISLGNLVLGEILDKSFVYSHIRSRKIFPNFHIPIAN
jgi:hypothetical protein